jgi:hypothetical protein
MERKMATALTKRVTLDTWFILYVADTKRFRSVIAELELQSAAHSS